MTFDLKIAILLCLAALTPSLSADAESTRHQAPKMSADKILKTWLAKNPRYKFIPHGRAWVEGDLNGDGHVDVAALLQDRQPADGASDRKHVVVVFNGPFSRNGDAAPAYMSSPEDFEGYQLAYDAKASVDSRLRVTTMEPEEGPFLSPEFVLRPYRQSYALHKREK